MLEMDEWMMLSAELCCFRSLTVPPPQQAGAANH